MHFATIYDPINEVAKIMQCSQTFRAINPQTIARMMIDTHNTHYIALITGIYALNKDLPMSY